MANFSYDYKSNKTVSGTSGWDVLTLTTRDVNGLGYFGDAYFEGNDLILVSAQNPSISLRVVNQLTTGNIEQITYVAANGAYATYSLRIGSIDTDMSAADVAYDIFGTNANDSIYVGELHSEASGSGGDDVLVGGAGDNYLVGGRDNDQLFGGDGDDWLYGDEFRDAFALLYNSEGNDYLNGGRGNDHLFGSAGSDRIIGGSGNDKLYGGTGNDSLRGDSGNDTLYGDAGKDTLTGGTGSDLLYGGADSVQDVFIFNTVNDSKTGSTRDKVYDFRTKVDDLDLQGIDANTTLTGNQEFSFSTTSARANSVWYKAANLDGNTNTKEIIVYGDVNGDAKADFEIGLMGVTSLIATDFLM
jgi:Ca2+-binding RTX toxin-like protein